ncbi:MAG TPA: hypothetical protein VN729_03740 [Ktedonobacteraceae bacterium]|nr:hypothetical protein [Ktedonobacteraceae bacterium]
MRLLLSCISTKHSVLKDHWTASSEQTACPLTVLGSFEKPKQDLGGLLCFIEEDGTRKVVDLNLAAGMVDSENGVLVTTFSGVHEINPETGALQQDIVSLPLFNALHSISRSRRGYLVASTGVDLLVEFNLQGEVLWTWWATDHGFDLTPTGERRELDKTLDQRVQKFGTLAQTTHVNSVAELPDGRILATLFHQGTVIAIDRETGAWQTLLEGLDHPHAVRVLDEEHFTIADTVHGKALLVSLNGQKASIETEIDAGTDWLQDCRYDARHNCWVLVDGKNSRIVLRQGLSGEQTLAQYDLDPEWRLYEAHVLA